MTSTEMVFWFTLVISALVVILTVTVIAVAIYFQTIRKKIEAEIFNCDEPVKKMTVKKRRKLNKYSTSHKRNDDREPSFYDSPPLMEGQKEVLMMRTFQRLQESSNPEELSITGRDEIAQDDEYSQERPSPEHVTQGALPRNINRQAKTKLHSTRSDGSYIECIRDDELFDGATFQNKRASAMSGRVTQVSHNDNRHAKAMSLSSENVGSYIEFTNAEEPSRMETYENATAFANSGQGVSHNNSRHAKTMPRSLGSDGQYNECISEEHVDGKTTKPSPGVTLPKLTSTPVKKQFGCGSKDLSWETATQQPVLRNTNRHIPSDKGTFGLPVSQSMNNDPSLDTQEMYEIMERGSNENDVFYENSAFDPNEEMYGNQEIVDKERKRLSAQDNKDYLFQEKITTRNTYMHNRMRNSSHQDNYGEEIYENHEIVNRERNKRAERDITQQKSRNRSHANTDLMAKGQSNSATMDMNSTANSSHVGHIQLYENYNGENMYENC